MAARPDVAVEWDARRALILLSGAPASAEQLFPILTRHPLPDMRIDSLRWGLACRVVLEPRAASARLHFEARRGRLGVEVPSGHRFVCDNVAVAGRWFPIEESAVEAAARAVLGSDEDLRVNAASALEVAVAMRASGIDVTVETLDPDFTPPVSTDLPWSRHFTAPTKLFPFQVSGVEWLRARYMAGMGALLADEMGLGKTVQAIAWVAEDVSRGGKVLIVSPASLTENWRRELLKFAGIAPLLYVGRGLASTPVALSQASVVLTTYDSVRVQQLVLEQVAWSTLVADEAQYIKNPESGRSMALKALPRERALAVTGTPLENRLSEVVSVLELIAPRVFGPMTSQREEQLEAAWEHSVRPFMSSLMLRREVKDVRKDLPPKVIVQLPLVASVSYAQEQSLLIRQAQDAPYNDRLALITRLRRLSGSEPVETSGKGEHFGGILRNLHSTKAKALVFASFTTSIDAIQDFVRGRGIACATLTGSTPPEDRQGIIDAFSQHPEAAVLVLNPRAGGVGLNITSASVVVHWEPEWNPAVTDQATARAHRSGQEQTVLVYSLFYANSIEEYMVQLQAEKRALAADAVRPSESTLTADEIDRMFEWLDRRLES